MSRFYVDTVSGYLTMPPNSSPPGLSAQVYDRVFNHALVATYRSEDHVGFQPSVRRGKAGALKAAEEHAARLNAEYDPKED